MFLFLFLGVTRILGFWTEVKKGDWMDPLEKAPEKVRRKLAILFRFVLFLDFQFTAFLKVRVPLFMGKIVICDRYAYDLIMELMVSNLFTSKFGALMLRTIPVPRKVFFADTQLSIILDRRPGSNQQRVWAKRNVYRKLAENLHFQTINTLLTLESNQEFIKAEVSDILDDLRK